MRKALNISAWHLMLQIYPLVRFSATVQTAPYREHQGQQPDSSTGIRTSAGTNKVLDGGGSIQASLPSCQAVSIS
ncbi:hypothetical protein V8C37DRAFT_366420 [Trichoderma ceciliae]